MNKNLKSCKKNSPKKCTNTVYNYTIESCYLKLGWDVSMVTLN